MAKITIKNVRLSFPSLFSKAVFQGAETKYEATLLIDKTTGANDIKNIKAEIAAMLAEHKVKLPADKICLKDGDEMEYDGYAGTMSLKASNKTRPMVVNKDKSPIVEDDNIIYSGCYVNAVVSLWFQNNAYGKRVNCSLEAVQFAKDGQPFGDGGSKASLDDFDILDDGDSEGF